DILSEADCARLSLEPEYHQVAAVPIPPSGSERRAAVRYPCNLDVSCRRVAAAMDIPWPTWPAKTRDISKVGIGLRLGRHYEPGTLLAIEVKNTASLLS